MTRQINDPAIKLDFVPKKGGIYSIKLMLKLKNIFYRLEIEHLWVEELIVQYSRFMLEEMIFDGQRELQNNIPNGTRFFRKISEYPLKRKQKAHPNLKGILEVNNIKSYSRAMKIIGSLSRPSKIPTFGYALPAMDCKSGSELRNERNSSCSKCYGYNGWYSFGWVRKAMEKRSIAIFHSEWVDGMVYAIKYHMLTEFRWHDTGDLQSVEHLKKICDVAYATPEVKHWLPTQEPEIVYEYWKRHQGFPENLRHGLRLSAKYINGEPPVKLAKKMGIGVSKVVSGKFNTSYDCPSSNQNGQCKSCRRCWNDDFMIIYKLH